MYVDIDNILAVHNSSTRLKKNFKNVKLASYLFLVRAVISSSAVYLDIAVSSVHLVVVIVIVIALVVVPSRVHPVVGFHQSLGHLRSSSRHHDGRSSSSSFHHQAGLVWGFPGYSSWQKPKR